MITEGITLLSEGYAEIGFGHIRRSVTLAHELARSVPVRVWVVSGSEHLEEGMTAHFKGLEVFCGPFPDSLSELEIIDLEPETARRHLLRTLGKTRQLCLDYFNPDLLPTSTINLIDHSQAMKAAYNAAKQNNHYMEGPQYAIIRPSMLRRRPSLPSAKLEVSHLVITFGGADPAGHTLRALQYLKQLALSGTQVTAILGPLTSSAYEQKIRTQAPSNTVVLRAPENYDALVARADVVLSSGGGTLLESLCLGKPTVVFPQTTAEANHAESHFQAGACVMESDLPQILNDPEWRHSLAVNAHRRVDGFGVERIAETALKLLAER